MRKLWAALAALLLLGALLLTSGCSKSESFTGFYMDTFVELTATGKGAEELLTKCSSRLAELEHALSAHRAGCDIYRVNEGAGEFVTVSPDTLAVVQAALTYAEMTHGAYDPTILPAVSAWDSMSGEVIPTEAELAAIREVVDYTQVEVDAETCAIRIGEGQGIDLGGIGKGYAADELLKLYREAGCTGIINLGGNIYAVGGKTKSEPWKIGIQNPDSTVSYLAVWEVQDACVVTSGDYQRYFERDGVHYHHILDPDTLTPTQNGLRSVTISCETAAMADAFATAAVVMGPEAGQAFLEDHGLRAFLILSDGTEIEIPAQ